MACSPPKLLDTFPTSEMQWSVRTFFSLGDFVVEQPSTSNL